MYHPMADLANNLMGFMMFMVLAHTLALDQLLLVLLDKLVGCFRSNHPTLIVAGQNTVDLTRQLNPISGESSSGTSLGTKSPEVAGSGQPDAASGEDTAHAPQLEVQDDRAERELIELRHKVRELETRLATADPVPVGRLLIRGRLVPHERHLWVVPEGGRPVKLFKVEGWEFPGELGDQVLAEAEMRSSGWAAWRVMVEKVSGDLPDLEPALVEKLTAIKPKKGLSFEELDLDVVQNQVRKASHSAGAVSLHIVLPTHARFGLTEDQAGDLKAIVNELVTELDLGRLEAIEVGHTEGGRQRDHLHLLVSGFNHAGKGIGEQIGRLKALSSGRLRRRHRDLPEKLWSASYWVSSAGGGALDKVRDYVLGNDGKHRL